MWRHVFVLFFSTSLAASATAKPSQNTFVFSDSSHYYILKEIRGLKTGLVINYVKKAAQGKKAPAVKKYLDSLGFFSCRFDTLAKDTVLIDPGGRSRVDSIRIKNAVFLFIDSVARLALPRPYDGGEIQLLAKKTIHALGARGYPYASLSVNVRPSAGQGLIVDFDVRENGKYAFAKPLIVGKLTTSRRLLLHDIVFREGEPFDLRKVEESRNRLLSRPYVTSADVSSPTVLLEAELTSDTAQGRTGVPPLDKVIVPFSCGDKRGFGFDGALTFQAGGAAVKNSFYGVVNISLLNLLGGGETAELSYNGQIDMQRMELSVAKPYLLDFPVFGSLDFGLEIRQDSSGYLHGGIEMLTELAAFWQLGLAVRGHEVLATGDSSASSSQFAGVDIILSRRPVRFRAGEFSKGFSLRTGSGLAWSGGRRFDRWHADCEGRLHVPFSARWAAAGRLVAKALFTDPADTLRSVELYRTGGYNSIRGYADNEFAFATTAYGQAECLFYFNPEGAIYIFSDAGLGFAPLRPFTLPAAQKLFSYGVGIRIPSKIGSASIEWARNYTDIKSFGRIHVKVMNPVAAGMGR